MSCLVDFGAETTTVSIYKDGLLALPLDHTAGRAEHHARHHDAERDRPPRPSRSRCGWGRPRWWARSRTSRCAARAVSEIKSPRPLEGGQGPYRGDCGQRERPLRLCQVRPQEPGRRHGDCGRRGQALQPGRAAGREVRHSGCARVPSGRICCSTWLRNRRAPTICRYLGLLYCGPGELRGRY